MAGLKSRALLFVAALVLALSIPQFFPALVAPVEHTLDDWRTRYAIRLSSSDGNLAKASRKEERVVIVDIDEKSLAEQGRWPWSREKIATLVRTLIDDYGVTSVAIDMVNPEHEQGDELLAFQLKRPEVTGSVVFDLLDRRLPAIATRLPGAAAVQFHSSAPRFVGTPSKSNHQSIMPSRVGHITPLFDSDGAIRRVPPAICESTPPRQCIALMDIVAFSSLIDGATLAVEPDSSWGGSRWAMRIRDPSGAQIISIPLSDDGSIVVPYRHLRDDWLAVSASDILNHRVDPTLLKGTISLLSSSALGMADVVSTPVSAESAGLEPHAEILAAMFDDNFLVQPKIGLLCAAVICVLSVTVLGLFQTFDGSPFIRAAFYPIWLILAWIAHSTIVMFAFVRFNWMLPTTPLFIFPPLAVLFTVLFETYKTNIERIGLFDVLSSYLPRQVAKRLSDRSSRREAIHGIDASRREITVLFADVRGFTGLVEHCDPESIAVLMHRVFGEMASAVVHHGGTIDKFIGDAVMAFWNAPDNDDSHAQHAYEAAREMLRRIEDLDAFCRELGIQPVTIGIGIESGQALVGHFGSGHRRTYTALGETVVLASRLEGLSVNYERSILIGPCCAKQLKMLQLEHLGEAQIRGRKGLVDIYAPQIKP